MAQFKEPGNDADPWPVVLDITTAKRVKRLTGYWLLDLDDLKKVTAETEALVDVLFAVCQPTASERGINDEAFGQMLTTCYGEAVDAFFEELGFFCRKMRQEALATLAEKTKSYQTELDQAAAAQLKSPETTAALERIITTAQEKVKSELEDLASKTSTDSPAQPASSQAP